MIIGKGAFSYCDLLEQVTIPDTVIRIEYAAFGFSKSLKTLRVPDSVDEIGIFAFEGIDKVYYDGNASGTPWGAKEIISIPKLEYIVSDNAKESFALFIDNFKDLKTSFQELSDYDDMLDKCRVMDFKDLKKILDMGLDNHIKDKFSYFEAISEETKELVQSKEFFEKFDNVDDLKFVKKFVEQLEELLTDFDVIKRRLVDRLSFLEYIREEVEEKVKKQIAEANPESISEMEEDDLDDEEFENRFFADEDEEDDLDDLE